MAIGVKTYKLSRAADRADYIEVTLWARQREEIGRRWFITIDGADEDMGPHAAGWLADKLTKLRARMGALQERRRARLAAKEGTVQDG